MKYKDIERASWLDGQLLGLNIQLYCYLTTSSPCHHFDLSNPMTRGVVAANRLFHDGDYNTNKIMKFLSKETKE